MATSFQRTGNDVQFTAGANLVSGDIVALTSGASGECGVVLNDVANGAVGVARRAGVVRLPKSAGALARRTTVYWDAVGEVVSTVASGKTLLGKVEVAATTAATSVDILLNDRIGHSDIR